MTCTNQCLPGSTPRETAASHCYCLKHIAKCLDTVCVNFSLKSSWWVRFSILWLKKSKFRVVEFRVAQVELVTEQRVLCTCPDPTELI